MRKSDYEKLIKVIKGLSNKKEEELKKLPYHLNVISSAARGKLKETAHSMILSDLLNFPDIQKSFLNYFFAIDENKLTVEREKGEMLGRPDIILSNDKRCIIIENKVNNAPEEKKQCGRYYLIALDKLSSKINKEKKNENIYFLYLNPNDRSLPSKESLTIPSETHKTDVKFVNNVLKEHFIVRSFAYDIRNWLYQLYKELNDSDKDEEYLKSGIHQYIDYLENYFNTSKKFNIMNEQIEKYLTEGSNTIEKFDTIEKLITLKEQANELVKTVSNIINMKTFNENKRIIEKIYNAHKNIFTKYYDDSKELGIRIKNDETHYGFCIETNLGEDNIFYGIKYEDEKQCKEDVLPKIKELLNKSTVYKQYGKWVIFKYVETNIDEEIYNEFESFVNTILSK